jgi:hypothetical protein
MDQLLQARKLPRVMTCSNCGAEPERARFCLRCGSSLTGASTPDEESKIVTVLYCEAMGSPAASVIPRIIRPCSPRSTPRLKCDVEGYGGTVDKFMGPVVMSVFGAPVQHEDDPHRAGAALKIQRSIDRLNDEEPHAGLQLRMGANTGEVVVAFGPLEEAVALAEDDAEVTSPRGELSVETVRAIVAEARGDLADAARRYGALAGRWSSYGFSLEEGQTLLGAGRCLIESGRTGDALQPLRRARAILSPLGVRPLLEEIVDLLEEETALTS